MLTPVNKKLIIRDNMRSIEETTEVTKLYLTKGVGAITPEIFDSVSNLEVLIIRGSDMCLDSARVIANFISNSSLKKLAILNCCMKPLAMATIIDSVRASSVQKLSLCQLPIKKNDASAIIEVLKHAHSQLVELFFVWCAFESQIEEVFNS